MIDQQRQQEEASQLEMRKSLRKERSTVEEPEEYSLLDQRQRDQEMRNSQLADKGNRFDLSSFFSSPNAIPGRATEAPVSKITAAGAPVANEPVAARTASTLQTSTMFPSVAQKEFRPRRNSRSSLFSPAKSSPVKSREPAEQSEAGQSMSPETPEKLQLPTIAQKKNFTPRPRQTNQAFQPSSAASASVAPTPPRMQLSRTDIQRWQQQTSNASQSSPEALRPLLRPLPPRNASPSKSSLRSPLKPHTPGRVVDFTSSVLSPADQALIRQQRRLSAGSGAHSQNSLLEVQPAAIEDHDKENQDSDVSMTDASPEPQAQKQQPLSQTTWTRQHWLLLDNIIRHRLQGEFEFEFPRRADKYLGKTVKGNGEAIVLERWHLECVDAFNDIVGGWNEGVLAKRVFSLIMAAERRRRRPQRDVA
jgi:serine/arginine repetitive matrix protein 2